MKKIQKFLIALTLPLTTSVVFGVSSSLISNSKLSQNINNTPQQEKNLITNFNNWNQQTSFGSDEQAITIATNIYKKYIVETDQTKSKFLLFAECALDPKDPKTNERITAIKNGLDPSNLKIMDSCRFVVQKMIPVAQTIVLNNDEQMLNMYKEVCLDLVNRYYKYGEVEIGNWWNYEIGLPKDFLKSFALVYNRLSETEIKEILSPITWFQNDAGWGFDITGISNREMKLANLIDSSYSVILYSFMLNDFDKLEETVEHMLNSLFGFWKSSSNIDVNRNGFYQDG